MIMKEIPKVRYAVIGGSGTWAGEYPENTGIEGIRILQRDMEFETPFGTTVPMKLFELDGSLTADGQPRQVLTVPFHGFHGPGPLEHPFGAGVLGIPAGRCGIYCGRGQCRRYQSPARSR